MVCLTVYGFDGLGTVRDPARVAAQIITGIGFLGAGTIFRSGSTVRGLTTASSIWITAAIGMVAGLGLLVLAGFTTLLTWFTLRILKNVEMRRKPDVAKEAGEPSRAMREDDDEEFED